MSNTGLPRLERAQRYGLCHMHQCATSGEDAHGSLVRGVLRGLVPHPLWGGLRALWYTSAPRDTVSQARDLGTASLQREAPTPSGASPPARFRQPGRPTQIDRLWVEAGLGLA